MDDPATMISPPTRRWIAAGLVAGYVAACGGPYLRWLEHPSLYHDDFLRVWSLRNTPIAEALFRPFNEHMAPLFEAVSYLAWRGAGGRVEAIAVGFMAASFAALGATLAMLGLVVGRETRSSAAALIAVAVFALSSVSAEVVLWYSASSFQWAAAGTLAAWYSAVRALESEKAARRGWLVAAAVASMASPAFSAIGALAAPLAMLRLALGGPEAGRIAPRLARALIPGLGLGAYLVAGALLGHQHAVAASVRRHFEPAAAIWASVRAPGYVLLPGLIGLGGQERTMAGWVAALATLGLVVGAPGLGRRRPLAVGGLALIAGGYALTYATRARSGDLFLFEVGRYHLFPQIGLACLIGAGVAPTLRRWTRTSGLLAALAVAVILSLVQGPGIRRAARPPFRFDDQPALIAAAAHLEAVAARESIPQDQLFRLLGPARVAWTPEPWPFHPILFLVRAPAGPARWGDAEARAKLVEWLAPADRALILGER